MEKIIMIKYGELTTKKSNRKVFINLLRDNVLKVVNCKVVCDRVRMYVYTDDETAVDKLKKVFGIHGIVVAYKVNTSDIENSVLNLLVSRSFKTFKVITKRANKKFEMSSMEYSAYLGGKILKKFDCSVDVKTPDLFVNIEIRDGFSLIYFNEVRGIGGYPVGVAGSGLLMLSGGIDSPVAGYLAMKRGVRIDCVYFDSPPHTSIAALNKVKKLASILNEYSYNVRLFVVPFTKMQETIYQNVDINYNITIMRRMMYRICSGLCDKYKCKILINGESIGQVASQTLDSMSVINCVINKPVIRPVACFDKLEIIDISKKIGTYEISILPFEDCCTIFVPKHPVINPSLSKCDLFEKFSFLSLIEDCIDNTSIVDFGNEYSKYL